MSHKRLNTLAIIGAAVIVLIFGLWLAFKGPGGPSISQNKEPEAGGPQIVYLNDSAPLTKILLPKQFDITKQAINDYIKQRLSASAKSATIVGQPQQDARGVITMEIKVDNVTPAKEFVATVDPRSNYKALTFAVPQDSYTETFQVYTN